MPYRRHHRPSGFLLRFFFRHDLISIFYGVPDAAGVTEDETCFTVWREYLPGVGKWNRWLQNTRIRYTRIRSASTFRFRFAGRSAATATLLRVCTRQAHFRDMWSGFRRSAERPQFRGKAGSGAAGAGGFDLFGGRNTEHSAAGAVSRRLCCHSKRVSRLENCGNHALSALRGRLTMRFWRQWWNAA